MQLVFSRKLSDSHAGISETRTKIILCHLTFSGKTFLTVFKNVTFCCKVITETQRDTACLDV
jgi:hypothetical protein